MMMRRTKFILLFVALLLPGCVFLFLKMFGKNEFAVAPLFQQPESVPGDCGSITFPYRIADSVLNEISKEDLTLIVFGEPDKEGLIQWRRIKEEFEKDALYMTTVGVTDPHFQSWRHCIFLLKEPFNAALVDKKGTIRGQYTLSDREDIDRLITEITIILKKY